MDELFVRFSIAVSCHWNVAPGDELIEQIRAAHLVAEQDARLDKLSRLKEMLHAAGHPDIDGHPIVRELSGQ